MLDLRMLGETSDSTISLAATSLSWTSLYKSQDLRRTIEDIAH